MKNNKGFTLVEIIVVLVILGILAAATIPSMMGFVEQAKQKAISAEGRACFVAAQAFTTERASNASTVDKQNANFYSIIENQINGAALLKKDDSGHHVYTTAGTIGSSNINTPTALGEVAGDAGHITPANPNHVLNPYLKDDCQGFISNTLIEDGKVVRLTYTRDHQQVTFDDGEVLFKTRDVDVSDYVTLSP